MKKIKIAFISIIFISLFALNFSIFMDTPENNIITEASARDKFYNTCARDMGPGNDTWYRLLPDNKCDWTTRSLAFLAHCDECIN